MGRGPLLKCANDLSTDVSNGQLGHRPASEISLSLLAICAPGD
jgi:hypothetical protein